MFYPHPKNIQFFDPFCPICMTSFTNAPWFFLQKELDQVLADNPGKSVMDLRSQLHYTEAVLLEIQRRGNVVPTALLHSTTVTTNLENYVLPKGTHILPSLTSILMDPIVFPNPDKFDPKRFLDGDGLFVPHPNVVPFGVGKRRCLGENLAKAELFVFFANLLHKFEIKVANENDRPSTMYRVGVTLSPLPFSARFIARG